MTIVFLAVICITSAGCALVGKGAGRKSPCKGIAEMSGSGEHKPAVDAARKLEREGKECPPNIQAAVARSRDKLQSADSYVRKALIRKKGGNLLSARANLEEALEIYPRYYWVQTLLKNVNRSIQVELDSLENEAKYYESRGDPEGALSRTRDAMLLSPGSRRLESEETRLVDLVRKARIEAEVQSVLKAARSSMEKERFSEAIQLLTKENIAEKLGIRGDELVSEVAARRNEYVRNRLTEAVEKEKEGDLDIAEEQVLHILKMSGPGDQTSDEVVNFARLLGLKLYSIGELSRAREIWTGALVVDPENPKLKSYLDEVETRLENLDRIKKGDSVSVGK